MKEKKVKLPMSKNKKRLIAVIVSVSVILVALITTLVVISVLDHRAPELQDLRPRIETLVESSQEVNELLWGKGLPTYPRVYRQSAETFKLTYEDKESNAYYYVIPDDTHGEVIVYQYWLRYVSEGTQVYTYIDVEKGVILAGNWADWRYATRSKTPLEGQTPIYVADSGYYYYRLEDYVFEDGIYEDENDPESGYDYVREDCGYFSVEELIEKAEAVFSAGYLSQISEGLFVGGTTPVGGVLGARYRNFDDPDDTEGSKLIKSNTFEPLIKAKRIYLFDTMTLHEDSNSTFVKVEVDSYLEGEPQNVLRVTLQLTLQDGRWMLDGPTY